jgi:hypothetical protein
VKALRVISKKEDALDQHTVWNLGTSMEINVLINAPGGVSYTRRTKCGSNSLQGLFLERAIDEFENKKTINNVILHLRAAVGHVWFRQIYGRPHCWLDRHIKFHNPERQDQTTSSCHGSVIIFMGRCQDTYLRWLAEFGKLGHIPGHNDTWSARYVPRIRVKVVDRSNKQKQAKTLEVS